MKIASEPTWAHGRGVQNEIIFPVKAAVLNLNLPAEDTVFAGSGGLEGGSALEGIRKPLAYGVTRYQKPVFVDPSNERYIADPAGVNDFPKVFETGNEIGSGNFTETLASGYFDLDAIADGEVRCHIEGQKFDSGAYSAAPGKIAEDLIETQWSGTANATSVSDYDTDFPYNCGIYVDPENNWTRAQAINWILKPLGILYPGQDGAELEFKVLTDPAGETAAVAYSENHIESIVSDGGPPPVGEVYMGYQEHKPIPNSLSGDNTLVQAQALPRSTVKKTDATTLSNYPNALKVVVPSPLDEEANADTVATTYLTLHKTKRHFLKVRLLRKPFHAWIGGFVSVKHADCPGLSSATKCMVAGYTLNMASRAFEMLVWIAV